MKKHSVLLSCICALLALSCAACTPSQPPQDEEGYDRTTDMNLGTAAGEEISPFLYGQFIEHIETCIYNGIWSEIVLDRKFYYEIGEKGLELTKAE